jgi:hypothetical protein
MAKDKGNAQGLGSVNSAPALGTSPKSGNESLGIDGRVAGGTTGSRPESSARYGGDSNDGQFFVGNSAAKDSKESNSGGGAGASEASGQYGPGGAEWLKGTYGSRENMPKYGGETNKGQLVGKGAGATKPSVEAEQVKRDMPTQMDIVAGTAAGQANLAKAKGGIGKPGKGGARM